MLAHLPHPEGFALRMSSLVPVANAFPKNWFVTLIRTVLMTVMKTQQLVVSEVMVYLFTRSHS